MVLINLVAILVLFSGLILIRYKFPKKELNLFVILILISILPIISLLREGAYESGDFNIHIYRIMSFYDSLKEGHLFPSWAAELNATYGNPLFIFNYSLPYYVISTFHALGFTFITSMKIYLGSTLFLSGIFMYLFVKEFTNNKLAAFTGAIFYIFSPYHLIDVHFRATLGESTIFALAPLVFYFLIKYLKGSNILYLTLTGLTTALLLQGHPLVGLTIIFILLLFTSYNYLKIKDRRKILACILLISIGIASSLYLWSSFLIFASYIYPYPKGELIFYPFIQLFYSPWRYGLLFQGPFGELALIIGYSQIILVFLAIVLLFLKKIPAKSKTDYIFWLSLFIFFLFLMNPASFFIWKFFPSLWMLIPTGRLLVAVALITSIIASLMVCSFSNTKIKKRLIYLLLAFTILSTILNWGHRTVLPEINDEILRNKVWKSTAENERIALFLNNKWADPNNFWFSKLPDEPLEIIEGKGKVIQIERKSIKHTYIVNASSPLVIKENTLFFPGWSLKSNTNKIDIYPGERGVINAKIPIGLQKLELEYSDYPKYKATKIISITLLSILLLTCIILIIKGIYVKMKGD